jgi:predicted metal-dependent HD superfamily phosphohydrolase
MADLQARWPEFIRRAGGAPSVADEGFAIISKLYGEPGRAYHALPHISWCLDLLDELYDDNPPLRPLWFNRVELALWFHDIIYDTKRKDNEARSAKALKGFAVLAGLPDQIADDAARDILLTTHDRPLDELWNISLPSKIVLDLDLASLGFTWEQFDRNSDQIREEYSWVPEDAYRAGRVKVLQSFLDRPRLYLTDPCFNRFEAQARENLARAIQKLR